MRESGTLRRFASSAIHVPTGTVKSRCARGRARLAEQLHELDPRREPDDISRNAPGSARVESVEAITDEEKQ